MEAYIDAIKTSGQLLEDMGHTMPKWILTSLLLFSLGEAYDSFIAITLWTNCKGEPDFDDLVSSLIDKEYCQGRKDNAIALAIRSKHLIEWDWSTSTTKDCVHYGRDGHPKDSCYILYSDKRPKWPDRGTQGSQR